MPENAEQREQYEAEHGVTKPELRALTSAHASRLIDRAQELANIAAVVTIRTRPKDQQQSQ